LWTVAHAIIFAVVAGRKHRANGEQGQDCSTASGGERAHSVAFRWQAKTVKQTVHGDVCLVVAHADMDNGNPAFQ